MIRSAILSPAGVAVALIAAAAPVQAAAPTLAEVQSHLAAVNSMTAQFTQTDRNGRVLTGTLTLKKPGKIRFQYQKGVPILIVADGSSLYFLDYQVGQKQRWPIGNSPLGILLNPNKDASKFAKIVPTVDPRVVTVEAYDPKHPEYGRITLIFTRMPSAPGGLMLQGWVTLDSQGNRTTIRLSGQQFNQPVADNMFRFTDPRPPKRGGR